MPKLYRILPIAAAALCLAGCAPQRWQIQQSVYSYELREKPDGDYTSRNTLLLDARTGRTWVMVPTDEDEVATYQWVEMPRQ